MDIVETDTLTDGQVRELVGLFRSTEWAADRDREDVESMLAGTDVVVGLVDRAAGDRLVAFARALTDGTYRTFVYDVVVAEDRRGVGFGRRVVDELLSHPDISDAEAVDLYCQPELVEFYEQWGFTEDVGGLRLLRRME